MKKTPCSVCGGTDLNLIDGFYYCVECGTQDVNAQETIVESTILADGTFAQAATRKIKTILKDGIKMSGEWHKWHTYNFILSGLVEELITLGAKPSLKMKVLWIWVRYVQKFQQTDENGVASRLHFEDDTNDSTLDATVDEDEDNKPKTRSAQQYAWTKKNRLRKSKELEKKTAIKDIKVFTKPVLLAILYIALNLDKSEIQLFHLLRYIKDGRVSLYNCGKFVPKEMDTKSIPLWTSFYNCKKVNNAYTIRKLAMSLFRGLNLGTPLIPDMRQLIDSYAKELCLPNDLKDLVFSLMNLFPPVYLPVSVHSRSYLVRMPDFEGMAMSYVIVALKMCFGLDNSYEIKLSNAVDKINTAENHLKCYKIGFLDQTDRLFSFREWCNYLMFRKTMLCKYYLPLADKYGLAVDDYNLMEQLDERQKRKKELSDEVTVDILNKIGASNADEIIAKNEFQPTLTPLSTYTEVIANHVKDQEIKLLLCEDFTIYSLKYVCGNERLSVDDADDLLNGVRKVYKVTNKEVIGNLICRNIDLDLVYVKNCGNKNWQKTKPPRQEHVNIMSSSMVNIDEGKNKSHVNESQDDDNNSINDISVGNESKNYINDSKCDTQNSKDNLNISHYDDSDNLINESKDDIHARNFDYETSDDAKVKSIMSDHNYDSNIDSASEVQSKSEITISSTDITINRKLETIEEEDLNRSIFDDNFANLKDVSDRVSSRLVFEDDLPLNEGDRDHFNNPNNFNDTQNTTHSEVVTPSFDPNTFNRVNVIRELILSACKKYKIVVPYEFRKNEIRERKKRKKERDNDNAEIDKPKRKCVRTGDYRQDIDRILADYYTALQTDVINQVLEQVRSAVINIRDEPIHDTLSHNTPDDNIDPYIGNNDEIDEENGHYENSDNLNDGNEHENQELVEDLLAKVIPKSDPKFDEKDYDTRQLYLRFKSEFKPEIVINYDDPELVEIIEKQIKGRAGPVKDKDKNAEDVKSVNESENESSIHKNDNTSEEEENKIMRDIENQKQDKLDPLINNVKLFGNYNYWIRHYPSQIIKQCIEMTQKFDLELQENSPSSFNFVLNECAAVLDCTTFCLYRHVQNLEERLIAKCDRVRE